MKFAHKFLVFIVLSLVLVLGANIFSLKFFATLYFADYLDSIKQESADIDFDVLSSFLSNRTLDDATLREYMTTLNDLSSLSESLKDFSQNPKITDPSLLESLQRIGVAPNAIERYLSINAVSSFVSNLSSLSILRGETPESVFVLRILRAILIVNLVLALGIVAVAYFWVGWNFRPIHSVVENLANLTKRKQYSMLHYERRDEFFALVAAINDLNESLSHQEKIRSDFLSDLGHEIKTPISAIKCWLEGIEDGAIQPDAQTLSHLREDIDRLVSITTSIMEYERLENAPESIVRPTDIDAADMARRIATEYRSTLQASRQAIVIPRSEPFQIWFDRDKWASVVHNAYSNFVKYAGVRATLTVSFERRADSYRIRFSDNGPGVEKDQVAYLKEKFYQVEKSRTKDAHGGIGIGLSIVDRIMMAHGGSLSIESAPRSGFTLVLDLPHAGFTKTSREAFDSRENRASLMA